MKNEEQISTLINEVGSLMLDQLDIQQGNVWLYAEVEPGMIAPSMYVDEGEIVSYVMPEKPLYDRIFDLWYAAADEEKWASLSYAISGTKVHVEFGYADGWSADDFTDDRLDRILQQRYAGRRIVYPPLQGARDYSD